MDVCGFEDIHKDIWLQHNSHKAGLIPAQLTFVQGKLFSEFHLLQVKMYTSQL